MLNEHLEYVNFFLKIKLFLEQLIHTTFNIFSRPLKKMCIWRHARTSKYVTRELQALVFRAIPVSYFSDSKEN